MSVGESMTLKEKILNEILQAESYINALEDSSNRAEVELQIRKICLDKLIRICGEDRSGHVCHEGPSPSGTHAFNCPTGEHLGGWVHMPGPHKTCRECSWG